jgi:hypothetical protein
MVVVCLCLSVSVRQRRTAGDVCVHTTWMDCCMGHWDSFLGIVAVAVVAVVVVVVGVCSHSHSGSFDSIGTCWTGHCCC